MKKVTCAGILVADLIAAELPRVSPPGGITFTHRDIEAHIGGHAANVSADLMRLGLKPGEVGCVGAVGNDPFADFFERTLSADGVELNLQRTTRARTSVDLILVVKGEDRRYHVGVGALSYLDPDFVIWAVKEDRPAVFYAGGRRYHLFRNRFIGCRATFQPLVNYKDGYATRQKVERPAEIVDRELPTDADVLLRHRGLNAGDLAFDFLQD